MEDNKLFYLKNINLNNFVTFKNKEIDFLGNFNAIVGETGSGKSLILDALQLVFGSRSDKKLIRKGCEFCTVEASFVCNDKDIKSFFDKQGYPFESNEIVIKRVIYNNGKSKTFINYQTANLNTLIKFATRYVDIVGQFENQKLLNPQYQIKLLDNFAGLFIDLNNYKVVFQEYKSLLKNKEELEQQRLNKEQRIDYLEFQLNEIYELNPSLEDYTEISKKKNFIKNSEELINFKNKVNQIISSDYNDHNLYNSIKKLISNHEKNSKLLENINIDKLYEALDLLSDYEHQIEQIENYDLTEDEIDNIVTRLDLYKKLQQRFGTDIDGLVILKNNFEEELNNLKNFTSNFNNIESQIELLKIKLEEISANLHSNRKISSIKLAKELTQSIRNLRMPDASIKINLSKAESFNENGVSEIEIIAETNPGEGFFKLNEVASGGELSRILLSFRKILSSKDTISIFLFDEIDTGIGGETALCIGKDLSHVSKSSQVIAITHLPQIANYADQIINIEKKRELIEKNSVRTFSDVTIIKQTDKKDFILSMTPLNQ